MLMPESMLIIKKCETLLKRCLAYEENRNFATLASELREALSRCSHLKASKPLVISLIGGTGAGKSKIFSTLCSSPDVSPSSDSVRGFTQKLYISASQTNVGYIPSSENAVIVPEVISQAVLIDTPDLDTINDNNAALSRQVIEASDIIVYVTTPDKRSNYEINQELIKWASRKRWYFVINKVDKVAEDEISQLKQDFDRRIMACGFAPDDSNRFLLSATKPDSLDFKRFADAIFSQRSVAEHNLIHTEACYRHIYHALSRSEATSGLLKQLAELKETKQRLAELLQQSIKQVLLKPELEEMYIRSIENEIYTDLCDKHSMFLYPYITLINRYKSTNNVEQAISSIMYSIKNSSEINQCQTDLDRTLEDIGMDEPGAGKVMPLSSEYSLQSELMQKARFAAIGATKAFSVRFYLFIANMLPLILTIQALYRAFDSWLAGQWLPADFFIHAVVLIIGSTIPGYFLLSRGVTRLTANYSPAKIHIELPDEILNGQLRVIEKLLDESSILCSATEAEMQRLREQIPENRFGAQAVDQD